MEKLTDEYLHLLADNGQRMLTDDPEVVHLCIHVHHTSAQPQASRFWSAFWLTLLGIGAVVALCHAQDCGAEHQGMHIVQEGTRDDPRFRSPADASPNHVVIVTIPSPGGGGVSISGSYRQPPRPPRKGH